MTLVEHVAKNSRADGLPEMISAVGHGHFSGFLLKKPGLWRFGA